MNKIVPVKPKVWNFEVVGGKDAWKEVVYSARVSGIPPEIDEQEVFKMIVRNDYGSALEHVIIKFNVRMSKGNAPELLEHRMSSHTGYSTRFAKVNKRYTDDKEQYEVIVPWDLLDITGNKGDLGKATTEELESKAFGFLNTVPQAILSYEELLESGVSRESARYVLPFCQAVGIYHFTINLRSLLNLLSLRLCVRSAPEMRCVASQLYFKLLDELPILRGLVGCRGFTMGICPEAGVTGVRTGKQHPVYPKCPFVDHDGHTFIQDKDHIFPQHNLFDLDKAIKKQEKIFDRWAKWEG